MLYKTKIKLQINIIKIIFNECFTEISIFRFRVVCPSEHLLCKSNGDFKLMKITNKK